MNAQQIDMVKQGKTVGKDYTSLFYATFDHRRELLHRLFKDGSIFSWNGNGVVGNDNIQGFVNNLPSTTHMLNLIDCIPMFDDDDDAAPIYMIMTNGTVNFNGMQHDFQATFMVTRVGEIWNAEKCVYRLQGAN